MAMASVFSAEFSLPASAPHRNELEKECLVWGSWLGFARRTELLNRAMTAAVFGNTGLLRNFKVKL